jgi:hypothetical protein
MTPTEETVQQLQKEWRGSVVEHMTRTETKLDALLVKMNAVQLEYARNTDMNEMMKRVSILESDKQRVVGAMVLLNALGVVVFYLINKFWK